MFLRAILYILLVPMSLMSLLAVITTLSGEPFRGPHKIVRLLGGLGLFAPGAAIAYTLFIDPSSGYLVLLTFLALIPLVGLMALDVARDRGTTPSQALTFIRDVRRS